MVVWISKTGRAAMSYGKKETAEMPREFHLKKFVGVRKIYNDGNFRSQQSVGIGNQ